MQTSNLLFDNFEKILQSLFILLTALATQIVLRRSLKAAFYKFKGRVSDIRFARTNTIRILIANIINTVIFVIAVLTILSTFGVDVRPVLAGLGILGVALSFGSQSLVKDFISGFFIIIEDQFHVGDKIKVGNYEGTVKKITIRSTVLRDAESNKIYIPNSKIDIVTQYKDVPKKPGK